MKSCENCRWVACVNYGKKYNICPKYIMSLEEEKRIEKSNTKVNN
jgi:predicted metal-binding protein